MKRRVGHERVGHASLSQGSCALAEEIKENPVETAKTDLMRVVGIGPRRAGELYDMGIHSFVDLERAVASGRECVNVNEPEDSPLLLPLRP